MSNLLFAAGPAGIDSGLRLWLDAGDTETIFTDTGCTSGNEVTTHGDSVRCWADKSGNGNDAIQGSGTPLWVDDGGLDAIEFTSDRLDIDGTSGGGAVFQNGDRISETEVFFVARTRTITNGWAFGSQNGGRRFGTHFPWSNNNVYFDVGQCCGTSRIQAAWGGSSSFLHTWNFINDDGAPNYQAIYRDGTLVASDGVADYIDWGTQDFQIGAYGTQWQQINAAEVIIYNRRLTDTERDQVKNYLLNKWREPIAPADDWTSGTTKVVTAPTGTDRLLVVAVGFEDGDTTNNITSVTYGGQTLTEAVRADSGTTYEAEVGLYYLLDTGITAATNTTITVNTSAATDHTDVSSAVYTGIDQVNTVFSTASADDGQSGLPDLETTLDVAQDGLTILAGQDGELGTWGSNLSIAVNESGNSTSHVVAYEIEGADEVGKTISLNHSNNYRMVLAAAHFRSNVLPAVTGATAVSSSDTSINLTWVKKASVPTYYVAYQSGATAPGSCELGTQVNVGAVGTYQVTGLTAGTQYSFRICANSGSNFTNGTTVSATTDAIAPDPPNNPLGVDLTINGPDSVSFSLVSGGGGTIGHRLAYKTGSTAPTDCTSDTQVNMGGGTTYGLSGLTSLTQYSYRICAYNGTPIYSSGLTGTFTTPGISSSSTNVHVLSGWQTGASRIEFGVGQNRTLVYVFGFENGSDIASVDFGGQAMTKVDNLNFNNARTEIWTLNESELSAAVAPLTADITFSGGGPTYTVYSSVVLANVDQSPLFSDTNNAGVNATTDNLSLNTELGGLSIVGATTRNNNSVATIDTAGWQTGIITSNTGMGFVTTYKESTAAGTDNVDTTFSGGDNRSTVGGHFKLADATAPVGLGLVSRSDVTINIDWTSGLGTTTGFRVAHQAGATAPADCSAGTDVGNVEDYSITGLTSDTEYGIRVCPYNAQGTLSAGITIQIMTNDSPAAAPNEIIGLGLTVVSESQISLNWTNGGGSTDSYVVTYLAGGTAPATCSLGTAVNVGTSTAYQVNGLSSGTLYSFRVCSSNANFVYSTGLTSSGTTGAAGVNPTVGLAGTWQTGLTRTMDAGSNRMLIFVASSEDTVDADLTSVTYGGQSLTHAKSALKSFSTTDFNKVEIWYLKESDILAATGSTFVVTWDQGVQSRRYYSHNVFSDVDQVNPLFADASGTFSDGIDPIGVNISGSLGGASISGATTANDGTYTINNGWTLGNTQNGNSSTLGTGHLLSAATQTETASFNHTGAGRSASAVIHLSPAEPAANDLSALVGLALNSSTIKLDWTSGGGTTSGFRVAYQTGASAPGNCLSGTQINVANVITKQVSALTASTQYSFRVCAYNASGEYTTGQTVTVTTSPPATNWTGTVDTDWFTAGNWDNGVPSSTVDCTIPNVANDPVIDGTTGNAACKNLTIQAPVTIDGSVTPVELAGYGQIVLEGAAALSGTAGSLTVRDSSTISQTLSSNITIPLLKLAKTSTGALSFSTDIATSDIEIEGGSNFTLNINSGIDFDISDDLSLPANVKFEVKQGGVLNIGSGNTLTVAGGTLKTSGVIETSLSTNPGYTTAQAHIGTVSGAGSFTFQANSGTVDLTGVNIDRLDKEGVQILGTTTLAKFDGVHLTNTTIGANGQGFLFNSTGSFPSTATYFALDEPTAPGTNYTSITSYNTYRATPNCGSGSHTMTFNEWYGNFYTQTSQVRPLDNAPTCEIIMLPSASPITLAEVQVTPFSDAIVLEWKTTAEILHKGFNIYRSDSTSSGYIKINSELVLNSIFSIGFAGEYRFIDTGVEAGKTYHYLLEDISTSDELVQHGPYSASLDPILGPVPVFTDDLNQYEGSIDFEDTLVNATNHYAINIAPGADVYQLPDGNLRLHIKPAAYTSVDSGWDANYKELSIPSYVKLSNFDKPALPFTEILIPIENSASNIAAVIQQEDSKDESILPVPAPRYSLVGGNLVPSWNADAATYSSSLYYPRNDHVAVETSSISIQGKNYIKVAVNPILFKGSDSTLKVLTETYINISYDEAAPKVATGSSNVVFNSLERNGARIYYNKAGHYKVSFDDLFQNGVDSPFAGVPYSELELTYKGKSIPLHIERANDEFFGQGDVIVFYAPFEKSQYSMSDSVLLSINTNSEGLRYISVYNGFEGSLGSVEFEKELSYEQDNPNLFVTSRSLGSGVDHYFWQFKYLESGDSSYPAASTYCHNVDLEGISHDEFKIELSAAPRSNFNIVGDFAVEAYFSSDTGNKVDLSFNGPKLSTASADYLFSFTPASTEELCFSIKPFVGLPSEYYILDFNGFKITYTAVPTVANKRVKNLEFATKYELPYDDSKGEFFLLQDENEGNSYIYKNFNLSDNKVSFTTQGIVSNESQFDIVYLSELFSPVQLSWSRVEGSLLDSLAESELLIITNSELKDEAEILANHKRDMDLSVSLIDEKTIYDHYSFGRKTPEAFKAFFKAVNNYPGNNLKYILFALDASVDARNYEGMETSDRSAVYMDSSLYHDFASDQWLLKDGGDRFNFSIGRLPVNNEEELSSVTQKIIDYESNQVPVIQNKISYSYVDDSYAEFNTISENYSLEASSFSKRFVNLSTSAAGTFQAEMEDNFIVNFMGHGSEYAIGSTGTNYLETTDVSSLSNEKLPIMLTLNCLSNYFASSDPSDKGLGEELLLKSSAGAISVISANTMLTPVDQDLFAQYFYRELERTADAGDQSVRLGDVLKNTRQRIHSSGLNNNQIDSILLLGDPSLKLPVAIFKTPVAPVDAVNPAAGGGGGGCSAAASDGSNSKSWPEGILEILALFLMGYFVRRAQKFLFSK